MKAAIWTRYGPPEVLELRDLADPVPTDDEILVRIEAANVFPGDCELRRFDVHPLFWLPARLVCGITRPRIATLGQELAGVVVEAGKNVTGFEPGDRIFSPTGLGGAYAEYVSLRPRHAVHIPPGTTFQEAATVSVGGLNALHFLRTGHVGNGHNVLIYGAGGSIGTLAVQIAKVLGAEVTAVDSTGKLAALRDVGADHVIDYTREDFTRNGRTYDVIIDVVGKSPFTRTLRSVRRGGCYVHGNASTWTMIRRLWAPLTSGRRVRIALAGYRREDLSYLAELLTDGRIRPVIDRCYALDDVVEAHRYVESGAKIGNVVLVRDPALAG